MLDRPYDHLWDMYYDEFEDEEEEDFESCTGCWYAEHGECSLGNESCHAEEQEK